MIDSKADQLASKTRRYLDEELPQRDIPKITGNADIWLQESTAILNEVSREMVSLMSKRPKEVAPFLRVFSLVVTLAADNHKLLKQRGSGAPPPPIAPRNQRDDNGDMEKRLESLEKDMKDVRERLARIETKIDDKASKSDVVGAKLFLFVAGAAAWVSMLGIIAKGFKWF